MRADLAVQGPARWSDAILGWRDRLLASPRFQLWAARTPFARMIARRRARELFDICAGFVYSQVLAAAVRLDVFGQVAQTPRTLPDLAQRLALPAESAARLVRALVSLRLLEPRAGDRFGLGPLGAAMVGNPGIPAMVSHHAALYADLADPVALLRGEARDTALGRYWPYARSADPAAAAPDDVAAYSALMAASQAMIAEDVIDAYPFARHRRLLDIGGGEGAFLSAVARRAPGLDLVLFDLPAVAGRARDRFAAAGIRAEAVGGDFFADPLPAGADVATLVRVVHDHDDAPVLALLKRIRAALVPGGTLVIAEPLAGTSGAEPIGDAYFGFYLLAMGQGRARSEAEIRALLEAAGFRNVRRPRTHQPLLTSVIVAEAPATSPVGRSD